MHEQVSKHTSFELSQIKLLFFSWRILGSGKKLQRLKFLSIDALFYKKCYLITPSCLSLAIIKSFPRANGTDQNTNKLLRALTSDWLSDNLRADGTFAMSQ